MHEPTPDLTELWNRVRDAARLIYTTNNFKRRGEFGELVLHLLLRDFCGTIPLISKIYFKDTRNAAVHGFDGIHVEIKGEVRKLWLGESKIYGDGLKGIKSLVSDIKAHFTSDYLRSEFGLISKKIPKDFPERDYWIKLMHENQTLDKIFSSICIPCVCTYSSDLFKNYDSESEKYFETFKKECHALRVEFEKGHSRTDIEIILLLLPIESKEDLVNELDQKLKSARTL